MSPLRSKSVPTQVSPEATARPVSTEGSQARLVSQAWNSEEGQVGLFQTKTKTKNRKTKTTTKTEKTNAKKKKRLVSQAWNSQDGQVGFLSHRQRQTRRRQKQRQKQRQRKIKLGRVKSVR